MISNPFLGISEPKISGNSTSQENAFFVIVLSSIKLFPLLILFDKYPNLLSGPASFKNKLNFVISTDSGLRSTP